MMCNLRKGRLVCVGVGIRASRQSNVVWEAETLGEERGKVYPERCMCQREPESRNISNSRCIEDLWRRI